ncbi:uncharacterized protein LOC129204876 [Grus americana]|uniref:uncharacterized protein LOC129204876 n=1 Tax=Grus americana TaxID=9117 RepID=UPI002407E97B|nr:uncharacterized protein LOC129204876 [Grus americana]
MPAEPRRVLRREISLSHEEKRHPYLLSGRQPTLRTQDREPDHPDGRTAANVADPHPRWLAIPFRTRRVRCGTPQPAPGQPREAATPGQMLETRRQLRAGCPCSWDGTLRRQPGVRRDGTGWQMHPNGSAWHGSRPCSTKCVRESVGDVRGLSEARLLMPRVMTGLRFLCEREINSDVRKSENQDLTVASFTLKINKTIKMHSGTNDLAAF